MSDTPSQQLPRTQTEQALFYKQPGFWVVVAFIVVVLGILSWSSITTGWNTPAAVASTPPTTVEARRAEIAKAKKVAADKARIDVIGKHEVRAKDAASKAGEYDEEGLSLAGIADDTKNATRNLVGVIQSELQIAESDKELKRLESCRKKTGDELEKCLKPFVEEAKPKIVRDYEAREAKKEEDAAAAAKAAAEKNDAMTDMKKRLEAAEKAAEDAKRIAQQSAKPKAVRQSNASQQSSGASASNAGQGGSLGADACVKLPAGFTPKYSWECKN